MAKPRRKLNAALLEGKASKPGRKQESAIPSSEKATLLIRLDPEVKKALAQLKLDEDAPSVNSLMLDAINLLFKDRGRSPIA